MDKVVELVVALLVAVAASQEPSPPPPTVPPTPLVTQSVTVVEEQSGRASWYPGSRGFHGVPHVALPESRWTGKIERYVSVCVNGRCERAAVVDHCSCYVGTKKERIVDMSIELVVALDLNPETGVWKNAVVKEIP